MAKGKAERVLQYFREADPAEAALVLRLAKAELREASRPVRGAIATSAVPRKPRKQRRSKLTDSIAASAEHAAHVQA